MGDSPPAAPPPAIEVVAYLCELGREEEEPEDIDQFRAQKLLFLTQGLALARLGRPLFLDPVEAWEKGPVVNSVYQTLKKHKKDPLPKPKRGAILSAQDKALIASVWAEYKQYSNVGLYQLVHAEDGPWKATRGDLPKSAPSRRVIEHELMASYFQRQLPPPLTDQELEHFATTS